MGHSAGVIAGGHELTVQAGEEVLRAGGNAYDAALAALAMAFVAEPVLASPGGGGFMLARPRHGKARMYDFFVHTPALKQADDELDFYPTLADFGTVQQEFHIGRGTVAVPGMMRGMFEIHRDLATMSMPELMSQAVTAARTGIEVTPYQAYLFTVVESIFSATAPCRSIYASAHDPDVMVRAGERLLQPSLADTLEILAIEGDTLFYRGEIAATIAADCGAGGQISLADLAAYEVVCRQPLVLEYSGARIYTNPAPSAGGTLVAFGLELLRGQDFAHSRHGTLDHVSTLVDALDLTGQARVECAAAAPDGQSLLDPALLARYRDDIGARRASRRGTTQLSVIDGKGNLASLTVSNGESAGCLIPGTGILLNNMLGEQDLNPGGFQRWRQAHRMSSMMAPTVIEWPEGDLVATGSGGSNRIRSAVLQVVSNVLDFGMSVEAAVEAPRVHVEGDLLSVEGGFDIEQLAPLLNNYRHHQLWDDRNMFFGGAHTVARTAKGFAAAGDSRRGGACRQFG